MAFPALALGAVVAIGRCDRAAFHQQRFVGFLVKRHIADGQRAERFAVVAVF